MIPEAKHWDDSKDLTDIMENALRTAASLEKFPADRVKKKTPTYNFTLEQIEAIKQKTVKESVLTLIELTLGLPVIVMHDKHGWRKGRLEPFIDEILKLYDSYENGYLTLEDIREVLWEEAGVRIQKNETIKRK